MTLGANSSLHLLQNNVHLGTNLLLDSVIFMDHQVDILVIGSGIAGAGVAAQLAAHKSVIVLDMEARPGYHSTGRSAAMFAMNYGNDPIKKLNRASWPMLNNLAPEYFPHPVLTDRGVLHVADENSLEEFEELLSSAGDIDRMSPQEAAKIIPILDVSKCVAAGLEREAKDLDVAALHQGWLKQAKQLGAQIVCDAKVVAATHEDGAWRVETSNGTYGAKTIIVNAAGAWADEVATLFDVDQVGLVSKRRTIATLPSSHPDVSHGWPMLLSASEDWYMKPDAGSFLVSPADEDPVPPPRCFCR